MIDVLSVEETAETLGCSRRRVFELLADGTLERAPRYGRQTRIYRASVDRALAPAPRHRRTTRARRPLPSELSVSDFRDLLTGT